MGKLIYMGNVSVDGYTEDETGDFRFTAPNDEEMHHWLLEHVSKWRTCLYGRKMYETMVYWETAHTLPDQSPQELEFARQWQSAEKIVYSKTLAEPLSGHTRIEREFDAEAVRALKTASAHDIGIGGPELAALGIAAGLVDEIHLRICPVALGVGKRLWPQGARLELALLEERRFGNGDVFLQYAVRT